MKFCEFMSGVTTLNQFRGLFLKDTFDNNIVSCDDHKCQILYLKILLTKRRSKLGKLYQVFLHIFFYANNLNHLIRKKDSESKPGNTNIYI